MREGAACSRTCPGQGARGLRGIPATLRQVPVPSVPPFCSVWPSSEVVPGTSEAPLDRSQVPCISASPALLFKCPGVLWPAMDEPLDMVLGTTSSKAPPTLTPAEAGAKRRLDWGSDRDEVLLFRCFVSPPPNGPPARTGVRKALEFTNGPALKCRPPSSSAESTGFIAELVKLPGPIYALAEGRMASKSQETASLCM